MSQSSTAAPIKYILGTVGLFAVFGFLALILSGFAGHESLEERSYEGDFSAEVKEQRWANFEEVTAAQEALVDQAKVDSALQAIAKAPAKAAKTGTVVPGSPTFLKQMEAEAAKSAAEEEKKKEAAPDAPKEAAPDAPKEEAPKAKEEKPKEAPKKEEAKAAPKKEAPKAAPKKAAPKKEAPAAGQKADAGKEAPKQ